MNKDRIDELVKILNEASQAYYSGQDEIMSNYEWDAYFDELVKLEQETGYVPQNSPTVNAGYYEGLGEKTTHEYAALSLAKTKNIEDLIKWANDKDIYLSWKLDGLTLVLTYDSGKLGSIVTRGDGHIGTNITYMKEAIQNIPLKIQYKGHLVVRGEAAITYTDFENINNLLSDDDEKYANPRNLAAGTLSLDKSNLDKVKSRKVGFYAFTLVHIDEEIISWGSRMQFLKDSGFKCVDYERCNAGSIRECVERWTQIVEGGKMDIPVDGLVICYDDTLYAQGGTVTGHHANRAGLAFKWEDESALTTLKYVEWSCAASTITPVAIFEPVSLEGTTVSRASLCNISEMERLGIGEDEKTTLEIIKANKIIPKCISVKEAQGSFSIPDKCPVCGAKTFIKISEHSGTKTLHCSNEDCTARKVQKFARFVSKQGMDIDGLSVQTIVKFINLGYIRDYSDIFKLDRFMDEIETLEGFGTKSVNNLKNAIEKSKKVHPVNFLYALCIPQIGQDAAKKITQAIGWEGFITRVESLQGFEDLANIGPERSKALKTWFADNDNMHLFDKLVNLLEIENVEAVNNSNGALYGLTFVITGDVHGFKNRAQFKAYVESQGGAVTSAVSKKTDYLVNNDVSSASSKNKKAKELQIPIISEDEFVQRFGGIDA